MYFGSKAAWVSAISAVSSLGLFGMFYLVYGNQNDIIRKGIPREARKPGFQSK
jgi:hypothetical protein